MGTREIRNSKLGIRDKFETRMVQAGRNSKHEARNPKQSQFAGRARREVRHCHAKQSQFPGDLACKAKPIHRGFRVCSLKCQAGGDERRGIRLHPSKLCTSHFSRTPRAEQSQFPRGGDGEREPQGRLCTTKPNLGGMGYLG